MSWSLKIRNGDLAIDGGTYGTVTGPEKLVQDLRCWILEEQGNDVMHPDYGSLIQGGMSPSGVPVPSPLGNTFSAEDLLRIESEVRRVIMAYQAQQRDRISVDTVRYNGKNTMSPGEILLSIKNISIIQNIDTALCYVTLVTGNGDVVSFTV